MCLNPQDRIKAKTPGPALSAEWCVGYASCFHISPDSKWSCVYISSLEKPKQMLDRIRNYILSIQKWMLKVVQVTFPRNWKSNTQSRTPSPWRDCQTHERIIPLMIEMCSNSKLKFESLLSDFPRLLQGKWLWEVRPHQMLLNKEPKHRVGQVFLWGPLAWPPQANSLFSERLPAGPRGLALLLVPSSQRGRPKHWPQIVAFGQNLNQSLV